MLIDRRRSCPVRVSERSALDLTGLVEDGCERLIDGNWLLDPAVTLSCGVIPLGLGDITVDEVELELLPTDVTGTGTGTG